jgi:hypothetical protein
MSDKCKALHSEMVYTLTDRRDENKRPTQSLIDEVYGKVLTLVGPKLASRPKNNRRPKGPTKQAGRKRRKRSLYARTQDLFKKNPNLLAKYLRGVRWPDNQDSSPLRGGGESLLQISMGSNTKYQYSLQRQKPDSQGPGLGQYLPSRHCKRHKRENKPH